MRVNNNVWCVNWLFPLSLICSVYPSISHILNGREFNIFTFIHFHYIFFYICPFIHQCLDRHKGERLGLLGCNPVLWKSGNKMLCFKMLWEHALFDPFWSRCAKYAKNWLKWPRWATWLITHTWGLYLRVKQTYPQVPTLFERMCGLTHIAAFRRSI